MNEMVEQLKQLGPLSLPQKWEQWDQEMTALAHTAAAEAPVACACAH